MPKRLGLLNPRSSGNTPTTSTSLVVRWVSAVVKYNGAVNAKQSCLLLCVSEQYSSSLVAAHLDVQVSRVEWRVKVQDRPSCAVEPCTPNHQLRRSSTGDLDVRRVDARVLEHGGRIPSERRVGSKAREKQKPVEGIISKAEDD